MAKRFLERRPRDRGYQPVDLVTLGYLLLVTALLIFSPYTFALKNLYVAAHLVLLLGVVSLRYVPRTVSGWMGFARDWYPLALLPFFYGALRRLN